MLVLARRSSQANALQDLVERFSYRLILYLDEAALCGLGPACTFFADVASDNDLWQRLAMFRNRLAAERFFGVMSQDARQVITAEDPKPLICPSTQSSPPTMPNPVDWRDLCRQLNTSMAERPWPRSGKDEISHGSGSAGWKDLTDGWRVGASELPAEGIYAGQSPHLFWLGGNHLLAFAGGYFADVVGGAVFMPLAEVYSLELPGSSADVHPRSVRATRLDCGTAGGLLPHGHPSMNGAASDFDPIRRAAFFFGGGSPHGSVTNATSVLQLENSDDAGSFSAHWEVLTTFGSVEAGLVPQGRQGLRGVVFEDEFLIFGGRLLGGQCMNDLWSLDLGETQQGSPSLWRQIRCDGQGPSPRVWYSACHAVHGRWFLYGGSTWQFEEPGTPHDFQVLYMLDLVQRQWSSINPQPSPSKCPPWVVASVLVPLASCQLLLLGGTLPHRVGNNGLNNESLQSWREWYHRLDQPHIFDLGEKCWSERKAMVNSVSLAGGLSPQDYVMEVLLRSHLAAVFVPSRRSVVVFGGSRYFTGEYFHDVLELQVSASPHTMASAASFDFRGSTLLGVGSTEMALIAGDLQSSSGMPTHLLRAGQRRATRGLVGRLRAMGRDGALQLDELDAFIREF